MSQTCEQTHGEIEAPEPECKPNRSAVCRQIIQSFTGAIEPVRASLLYQLGMLLVCITMICLMAIYLALIAAVAWGVYCHLGFIYSHVTQLDMRGRVFVVFIIYFGPLFAGATLLFLMLKPLFASSGDGVKGVKLKESDEPLLFDFVREICDTIRAPFPHTIQVDCQVNASASFRPGLASLLRGDLVLTIGLPLVAGLNMRQFAGVLAHELGHFSQRGAMRLSNIAIGINHWFVRAVYERDSVDDWLAESVGKIGVTGVIIVYATRLLVWVTRGILWMLMHVGHLVTFFMFRQMEFNADKYQARLVGSDTFEDTALDISLLDICFSATLTDLELAWKERRITDDLPGLVASKTTRFSESMREEIKIELQNDKTKWFATHPSISARIRHARKNRGSGVFCMEEPAKILVERYPDLATECSVRFYHRILGKAFDGVQFVSAETLNHGQELLSLELQAFDSFFLGLWRLERPPILPTSVLNPPTDIPAAVVVLRAIREQILKHLPEAREFSRRSEQARVQYYNGVAAVSLLDAGFRLPKGAFGLPSNKPDPVRQFAVDAANCMDTCDQELEPLAELACSRLLVALELLHDSDIQSQMGEKQATPDTVTPLLRAVVAMGTVLPTINKLRRKLIMFNILYTNINPKRPDQMLSDKLILMCSDMRLICRKLNSALADCPYPLDHAQSCVSIGDHLTGHMERLSEADTFNKASEVVENFGLLYGRILGRLGLIAEQAEIVVGLEPLEIRASDIGLESAN